MMKLKEDLVNQIETAIEELFNLDPDVCITLLTDKLDEYQSLINCRSAETLIPRMINQVQTRAIDLAKSSYADKDNLSQDDLYSEEAFEYIKAGEYYDDDVRKMLCSMTLESYRETLAPFVTQTIGAVWPKLYQLSLEAKEEGS